MLSSYVKGACAIYVYQGVWYAVENFALEESENSGGTLSCNAYGPEAEEALNEYIDSHDWWEKKMEMCLRWKSCFC